MGAIAALSAGALGAFQSACIYSVTGRKPSLHEAFFQEGGLMSTLTVNYRWSKPDVGGDADQWGIELNADLDSIDATVKSVESTANAKLGDAPVDHNLYGRQNGLWSIITGGGSGSAGVIISATPPATATVGALWWDSTGGNLYLYYASPSGGVAWVDVVGGGAIADVVPPPTGATWDQAGLAWDQSGLTWS
jgi:hypothetical protein